MAAIVPQKMNAKGSTQGCAKKLINPKSIFHMIAFANTIIYFQPKIQIGSLEIINMSIDCFEMLVVISLNQSLYSLLIFYFFTHCLYTHLMLPSVL